MLPMDDNAAEQEAIDLQYKQMPCRHCHKPMQVGIRKRNAPAHFECSLRITIDNQRQIAEKSGPYYDKWLAGQRAYLERLTRGGAPPQ
jgi:hypothetical protein